MADMAVADVEMRHRWGFFGSAEMTLQASGWICVSPMVRNVGAGRSCVKEKDNHYNSKNNSNDADDN